MQGHCSEVC